MALSARELQRRGEVARRLKAARWLRGGVRKAKDGKGKTGYEVYALEPKDLASRPGMAENQITASKIGSIERMERRTAPMELAVLARALEVPEAWFSATPDEVASLPAFDLMRQALVDLGLAPAPSPGEDLPGEDASDHPRRATGGDDA